MSSTEILRDETSPPYIYLKKIKMCNYNATVNIFGNKIGHFLKGLVIFLLQIFFYKTIFFWENKEMVIFTMAAFRNKNVYSVMM